jgi:6-phospho-3-hexuloisomerase
MSLSELSDRILRELGHILHQIHEEDVEKMVEGILSSDRVFVTGMGRSGLVAQAFAMRLMQIGFCVYVVGDATTPAIKERDLLIAISASGETAITHHVASAAKSFGARVFLLTIHIRSRIEDISDLVIVLPDSPQPKLPLRSAFETAAHILLEAIVVLIMEKTGVTQQQMMKRHSNLE